MKSIWKVLVPMVLTMFVFSAQAQYKLDNGSSKMFIDGTSSIHDWTETVESMSGNLNAIIEGTKISKVTGVNATIPVKSIKSGKSGMDDNTYKALKEKTYPNISYKLKSYAVEGDVLHLTGALTIAGVTNVMKFTSTYKIEGDKLVFTATHTFKMTDFKIDPPTAMMGTIKTGDEIVIRMELVFTK